MANKNVEVGFKKPSSPLKQLSEQVLNANINKHMGLLPKGSTLMDVAKTIKESQPDSLVNSSLRELLVIPASESSSLINRLTNMTEPRLVDDYFFKVHDTQYKHFVLADTTLDDDSKKVLLMAFENINNQVKESYMAMNGGFWRGIVDILAGPAPGSTGLFRGILGGFIHNLLDRDDRKENKALG
jgi:hypothetical protein